MATRLELLAFDRAARGGGQDTPAATPQVSATLLHRACNMLILRNVRMHLCYTAHVRNLVILRNVRMQLCYTAHVRNLVILRNLRIQLCYTAHVRTLVILRNVRMQLC